MAQPVIQHSFSSGEWAPALNARTDLAKYKSGAALLRNFFVDYRGGASSRFGTKYVLNAMGPGKVRLVRFVASATLSYILEFGQNYIRFYTNGAPVLEPAINVTGIGISRANPCHVTAANSYSNGDWIYISNVAGMTQLNGGYYQVASQTAVGFNLLDLYGSPVDSTLFSAWTSGGKIQRVYTVTTTYQDVDLPLLKFAQNVNVLYICHPNYQPSTLTLNTAADWTFDVIVFGSTVDIPGGLIEAANTSSAVPLYAYQVTAVDAGGQESLPTDLLFILAGGSTTQTVTITWAASADAVYYNVYRFGPTMTTAVNAGTLFGFVNSTQATSYTESFLDGLAYQGADFSISTPTSQNPFIPGSPVTELILYTGGTYATTPGVGFSGGGGAGAAATVNLQLSVLAIANPGTGYHLGDTLNVDGGIQVQVTSIGGGGDVTGYRILHNGGIIQSIPAQPFNASGGFGSSFQMTGFYTIIGFNLSSGGLGYTSAPVVIITATSGSGGDAAASIGPQSGGNPSVPAFHQQRLILASQVTNPQSMNFSVVGAYSNFNYSIPIQADDAIATNIVSAQLNPIKSMIPLPSGIITLTAAGAWQVTGTGGPITPVTVNAQAHAYNGASDVPPIVVNYDILYVQAKGSIVRDLAFNFYTQIYTGTDISVLSSHLFYGHQIIEWSYAEEPFKIIWAVREDGILLSLTYLKEQEVTGWAHSDTFGLFTSTASVPETVQVGNVEVSVDAVYFVVSRNINGTPVQYIERMADRFYPYGVEDSWCVDAALQTVPVFTPGTTLLVASNAVVDAEVGMVAGANVFSADNIGQVIRVGGGIGTITSYISPILVIVTMTQSVSVIVPNDPLNTPIMAQPGTWSIWQNVAQVTGLQHLAGQTVYGVADGIAIGPLTVSSDQLGTVTLPNPASKVTLGLQYTPQLQTLRLDIGEPTIQGKRKKIPAVTVRVQDTLGLSIGRNFSSAVPMKDLIVGNVGTMSNSVVAGLVTNDARTLVDPLWDVPGEYCIQQSNPFPATILGVIPEIEVGDTAK